MHLTTLKKVDRIRKLSSATSLDVVEPFELKRHKFALCKVAENSVFSVLFDSSMFQCLKKNGKFHLEDSFIVRDFSGNTRINAIKPKFHRHEN